MLRFLTAWEFCDGQAPLHWYAPAEAVLDSLKTVTLELPPDTAKHYSNLGIMLLGIALERACGQNIRWYLAEHVFAPLGLRSAGFLDEESAWDDRFPTGYGRSSRNGTLFSAPRWQLGGAMYTGGIYMTATDLARFCAAFLPPATSAVGPASVDLRRYIGRYRLPGEYAAAEVTAGEGLLRIALRDREADGRTASVQRTASIQRTASVRMLFAPTGPGQFGPPGTDFPAVTFQEDASGNIISFDYALFRFEKRD